MNSHQITTVKTNAHSLGVKGLNLRPRQSTRSTTSVVDNLGSQGEIGLAHIVHTFFMAASISLGL